jgi:hypothetical protein
VLVTGDQRWVQLERFRDIAVRNRVGAQVGYQALQVLPQPVPQFSKLGRRFAGRGALLGAVHASAEVRTPTRF